MKPETKELLAKILKIVSSIIALIIAGIEGVQAYAGHRRK